MGLILFKLEDVGEILFRLFESGISYSIESDCKNITYDLGDNHGNFINVLDDTESKSVSYTISRIARESAEEYPGSSFAVWYKGLLSSGAGQPMRRALFEVGGRMLYHEYTLTNDPKGLSIENERYCWGDGTDAERMTFDENPRVGGVLEFTKTKQ